MTKPAPGRRAEILGADFLRTKGHQLLASPFRTAAGEVDIVTRCGKVLVFVEVKFRQGNDPPEDAVNAGKRRRIVRAAHAYRRRYHHEDAPYRYDILAASTDDRGEIQFRLIADAFRDENLIL